MTGWIVAFLYAWKSCNFHVSLQNHFKADRYGFKSMARGFESAAQIMYIKDTIIIESVSCLANNKSEGL
jgi:hypothetical protein